MTRRLKILTHRLLLGLLCLSLLSAGISAGYSINSDQFVCGNEHCFGQQGLGSHVAMKPRRVPPADDQDKAHSSSEIWMDMEDSGKEQTVKHQDLLMALQSVSNFTMLSVDGPEDYTKSMHVFRNIYQDNCILVI